jgi:hypothetical protein
VLLDLEEPEVAVLLGADVLGDDDVLDGRGEIDAVGAVEGVGEAARRGRALAIDEVAPRNRAVAEAATTAATRIHRRDRPRALTAAV